MWAPIVIAYAVASSGHIRGAALQTQVQVASKELEQVIEPVVADCACNNFTCCSMPHCCAIAGCGCNGDQCPGQCFSSGNCFDPCTCGTPGCYSPAYFLELEKKKASLPVVKEPEQVIEPAVADCACNNFTCCSMPHCCAIAGCGCNGDKCPGQCFSSGNCFDPCTCGTPGCYSPVYFLELEKKKASLPVVKEPEPLIEPAVAVCACNNFTCCGMPHCCGWAGCGCNGDKCPGRCFSSGNCFDECTCGTPGCYSPAYFLELEKKRQ